jgi:sugar phosphate isomerase/epimerase
VTVAAVPADRLSINRITVKSWPMDKVIDGCARAGIHHVGLWLDDLAEHGTEKTARLLAQHDMSVSSVCRAGFFTGDDPVAALAENKRSVDLTAGIGCDVLYILAGGVPPDRDLPRARRMAADGLAELVPYARECGVRLAVEPLHPLLLDRSVVVTVEHALELIQPLDAGVAGLAIDTFNVWWDPHVLRDIARAGQRVISYQVCDWLVPLPHPVWGRGIPGDGVVDFPPLTRAVTEAGYTGPIEVEIFNEKVWDTEPSEVIDVVKSRFAQVF